MTICATSLVTHGMISCDFAEDQLTSCGKPEVVGVVEVRPKIRRVAAPEASAALEPKITTVQELKPSMTGQVQPETDPNDPPKNVSAQELKPTITKVQEE